MLNSNLMTRLQAKYELIYKALGTEVSRTLLSPTEGDTGLASKPPRRKRIGRPMITAGPAGAGGATAGPRLFGGSLEEYLEVSQEEIPLVLKSCVRVINLYGLHHQGIFRVSGSQVEINNFKESFERGDDPLRDVTDASDINSVAGVLKLYLRELREPLFPTVYFEQLIDLARESRC
jgi:SLIT-ROBO Rho GTPase activating protein